MVNTKKDAKDSEDTLKSYIECYEMVFYNEILMALVCIRI